MNFTFLVVVLLTALAFVGVVIALSRAISPRSYNVQKFEAYECGIPTRGKSWMQFRVGYYLFAILFLMFDVETAFLFPWAVVMHDMGPQGLVSILFFFITFGSGPCLCLEERSFGMEITKKPKIKSIPYDEFIDNESLEKLVKELNAGGANVFSWGSGRPCQLGTQQFTVAAYFRNQLLRYRIHGTGCRAL